MKKLFTLTAVFLLLTINCNAQKIRKTWDFRTGFNATTIANLNADLQQNGATGNDSHWRNYEKDASKAGDEAFWNADNGTSVNSDGYGITTVDGSQVVIPEIEGLNITGIKPKGFVICYNYGQKEDAGSPSGYYTYGKSFLWLNGKSLKMSFTALKGDTIRIGLESHKPTEARGINIMVDNEIVEPFSGNNQPTYYEDVVWVLPDDTPDVDDYCTVTISSTNGCHIYYIIAGEGDDPAANIKKISYLYAGTIDGDFAYQTLSTNEAYKVTAIDAASTTLTKDELMKYDVTVIAPTIPADNSNVSVLKKTMPWTPMLNFNANLYNTWGYGEAVATTDIFGKTDKGDHQLFFGMTLVPAADADLEEGQNGIVFSVEKPISGVRLGDYFAHDEIIADLVSNDAVAIHAHNAFHNGYLYLPYNTESMATPNNEDDATATLINNAITMLAASKADITNTPAPTLSLNYGNLETTVTIDNAHDNAIIYYTTDGSDPTEESSIYKEPFKVAAQTQVKAIAVSEGYNPSAVTDSIISIFEQTKAPVIAIDETDDQSTITLTCETADNQIWYNFIGSNDTLQSSKYTEPIIIRDYTTLTTFATSTEYVQSESVTKEIFVKNDKVYIDVASHFDANYKDDKNNGAGLFSWGKSAEQDSIQTDNIIGTYIDEDGIEQVIYEKLARETEVYPDNPEAEWVVKSNGQSVLWQNLNPGTTPGDGSGYNPATVADLDSMITKYNIQFYRFQSGQYNARVESTKKFQGPFNILTFLGNANGDDNIQRMAVEVSTDGNTWTQTGDTVVVANPRRLWSKYNVFYGGTEEVYVRLAQVAGNSGAQCFDIYVLTRGDKSKIREKELAEAYEHQASGINNINNDQEKATIKAIYNLNGTRMNSLQRGINIIKMSDGTTRKVLVN